jgi:phenylalanyl-tRNA synthetase beta chain
MKISYNWLKQILKTDWDSERTASLLTDLGLEVEGIEKFQSVKGGLVGIVVGHVLKCEKHPNADKLNITTVDVGLEKSLQIVCGAANVAVGQKVPVATIGTILYDKEGKSFEIKMGKIRGEDSHGMICAEDEIGLGESHDGIMVLDQKLIPGTAVSKVFESENDEVFEIGITPNRADAMSHWGTARDLKAGMLQQGFQAELITPSVTNFKIENRTLKIDVKVENSKLVPRYCGVTISNIKVGISPVWLQNRLKSIGINPKNNIVDVTNYVLHELGQPLHAFDASKIVGKINVKTVEESTKFVTLDDIERSLSADDIMICDDEKPLCIAGVFGGKNSGISENTTQLFLESAYFDAVSIRKTAKRHSLSTDASFRFERGIDPNITEYALKRAALLIMEVAGGEITSDIVDIYPKKIENHQVLLNIEKVSKLIGQKIPEDEIKNILASLEIKINSISKTALGLIIPVYRVDVTREVDVIEEILRIYGYNNINFTEKLNATTSKSSRTEDYKLQNTSANLLTAIGFNEIMANSLTLPNYISLSKSLNESNNVMILNPLSNDLSVMRQSMLFSGLEAISFNINRKNNDLKFFEFGKTYHKLLSGYEENKHLSLFLTGNKNSESWTNPQKSSDFFIFKSYVESVLSRLGISKSKISTIQNDVFSEGLILEKGNSFLVEFGIIKKSILKNFDIKQEVFYADFNWVNIIKQVSTSIKITEIAKYPEVRRDLALLIDEKISFEQLYDVAQKTEKTLLKEISLFDVFQGKNLPNGKKSYALSFILQDQNATLTDFQIEKVMTNLTKKFQSEFDAVLR